MTRRKTLASRAWTASERYAETWRKEDAPERDVVDAATGYLDGYLAGRRAERRAAKRRER